MSLAPLLTAPFAVQLHVATVVPAFLLGTWLIFFSRKGALYYARRHNIRAHRQSMLGVYIGGLLIAGSLTLLPGRIMHTVFFDH
jgi:uncharacterized membrane protein